METQTIIAGIIVLSALLYVGSILRKKVKAFSPKNTGCASDCGCDVKSKVKSSQV